MMGKLIKMSMKWLRKRIENMIKNKFDCIIFIEGNRGLGKSTFAYKLLDGLDTVIEQVINYFFKEQHQILPQ